jgi:phage shock protein E
MKLRTRELGILAVMLVALFVLAACGTENNSAQAPGTGAAGSTQTGAQIKTDGGVYTDLSPQELKAMLDKKDFFLVDTHIPPEGRLPQTDARIPYNEVQQRIGEFPSDKNAKIVLACRSGAMSTEASKTLVKLGYSNVYNLAGGMNAWKAAGYEIIPEEQK